MATPQTVAFHTLGCKLNFSETSAIKRQFENHGFSPVSFEDGADIYVLNTCSVTEFADRKCRYEVRRALKISPDAKIIVVGCYAQLKPEEIADIEGVDLVLGAAEKFNILEYVEALSKTTTKGMVRAGHVSEANSFHSSFSFGDRTRSFLKVQDGCNYNCSFCTIPQARGESRSDTIPNALKTAGEIAQLGNKEIVLTGVNLGDFGNGTEVIEGRRPKKEALFIDLIQELDRVDGIARYRISSIEPNLCSNDVIDFVQRSEKFVPHFHIPLQSGSDKILAKMRRRYKRELYADRVRTIKNNMPHACIGVDVIVGFPGETDDDFMDTYRFIENLDVSYLHVFTYSERANTPAAEMEEAIPMDVRKARNRKLRGLSEIKKRAFYQKFVGSEQEVLFENHGEPGFVSGFTRNYIKIKASGDESMVNTIGKVKLCNFDPVDGLMLAAPLS